MKVRVVPSPKSSKEFTVELQQGAKYFRLDYTGAKSECQWYAKMFRVALKKSEAESVKPITRTRKPKATTPEEIDAQFASAKKLIEAVKQ